MNDVIIKVFDCSGVYDLQRQINNFQQENNCLLISTFNGDPESARRVCCIFRKCVQS